MRFAKSLSALFASMALWAACADGGNNSGGSNAAAAAGTNAGATTGGMVEPEPLRGEDRGACLNAGQGGDCYAPNAPNGRTGSSCLCANDRQAGEQGRACTRNYTCNGTLTCQMGICAPPAATTGSSGAPPDTCQTPTSPRAGDEGCACRDGRVCGTGLEAITLLGACTCVPRVAPASSSSSGSSSSSSTGGLPVNADQAWVDTGSEAAFATRCAGCYATTAFPTFLAAAGATPNSLTVLKNYRSGAFPQGFLTDFVNEGDNVVRNRLMDYHAAEPAKSFAEGDKAKVRIWLTAVRGPIGAGNGNGNGASSSTGGPVGVGPITNPSDAMSFLGRCMQLAQFNQAVNGNSAAQWRVQNSGGGQCIRCHNTLNPQTRDTAAQAFVAAQVPGSIYSYATPVSLDNGRTYEAMVAYRLRDKGDELGTHPKYLLNENIMNAIKLFVEDANLRMKNNTANCRTAIPGQ